MISAFAPNFDRYPLQQQYYIPYGGNYSIPCRVEGAPLPDVRFYVLLSYISIYLTIFDKLLTDVFNFIRSRITGVSMIKQLITYFELALHIKPLHEAC